MNLFKSNKERLDVPEKTSSSAEKLEFISKLDKDALYVDLYAELMETRRFEMIKLLLEHDIKLCDTRIFTEECVNLFLRFNMTEKARILFEKQVIDKRVNNEKIIELIEKELAYGKETDLILQSLPEPILSTPKTIPEIILSRIYILANDSLLTNFVEDFLKLNNSKLLKLILSFIGLNMVLNPNAKVLITDDTQFWCLNQKSLSCNLLERDLLILNSNQTSKEITKDFFKFEFRELLHTLYRNGNDPYFKNDIKSKKAFDSAKLGLVSNFCSILYRSDFCAKGNYFDLGKYLHGAVNYNFILTYIKKPILYLRSLFETHSLRQLEDLDYATQFLELFSNDIEESKVNLLEKYFELKIDGKNSTLAEPLENYIESYLNVSIEKYIQESLNSSILGNYCNFFDFT